jgi:hypothetical protein
MRLILRAGTLTNIDGNGNWQINYRRLKKTENRLAIEVVNRGIKVFRDNKLPSPEVQPLKLPGIQADVSCLRGQ